MSWDDCMDIMDKYYELYYSDAEQGVKASELARWADDRYSPEEAELIKDQVKFWQMVPAQSSYYEKFREAGLSTQDAGTLQSAFSSLEPEAGKEQVTSYQKYHAVLSSDLDQLNKNLAMKALMSDEAFTGYMKAQRDGLAAQYIDALEVKNTAESEKDEDGKAIKGSVQLQVMKSFRNMRLNDSQKTALYQALGYDGETYWDTRYDGNDFDSYYYLSDSQKDNYLKYCSWMEAKDFRAHLKRIGEFASVRDENGKELVAKQDMVIAYIDSLPLLDDQKSALFATQYKTSNLKKCPWYNAYALRTEYFPG